MLRLCGMAHFYPSNNRVLLEWFACFDTVAKLSGLHVPVARSQPFRKILKISAGGRAWLNR